MQRIEISPLDDSNGSELDYKLGNASIVTCLYHLRRPHETLLSSKHSTVSAQPTACVWHLQPVYGWLLQTLQHTATVYR